MATSGVRLANAKGRASLVVGGHLVDVERASQRRFSSDPMALLARWDAFVEWAHGLRESDGDALVNERALGPPVPRPSKIFAIGRNYREHAQETGAEIPKTPVVFTKFPSCLAGPRADVVLSSEYVDWEVELVVALGRRARRIPEARAIEHVAGYCIGQDISDRKVQFTDKPPQFSMGKSFDGFGPTGPWLVSLDGFSDPNDLALSCDVTGERMQEARTRDMIFSVPVLIAFLSYRCTLEPGDLIFTGTPSGVGSARNPRRYLREGDEIVSTIERIGTMVNRCAAGES
jgi:2,4-diketo-3-deoxy-L-fuconate hydrolase